MILKVNLATAFNMADVCDQTALHYAAAHGFLQAVKLLLHNGASASVKDEHNRSPLHLASEYVYKFHHIFSDY